MTIRPVTPNVIQPHPNECPFVDRSFIPNPAFNIPKEYEDGQGKYIFYLHYSGFEKEDHTFPKNVQFCRLIGRKTDIFECLNTNERLACSHYRGNKHILPGAEKDKSE